MLKYNLVPVEPVSVCAFKVNGKKVYTYNGYDSRGVWTSAQARAIDVLQKASELWQGKTLGIDRPGMERSEPSLGDGHYRKIQGCLLRSREDVEASSKTHVPAYCAAPKAHKGETLDPIWVGPHSWNDWEQCSYGQHKRSESEKNDWREWTQKEPKQRRYASEWQTRTGDEWVSKTGDGRECWTSRWNEWWRREKWDEDGW